VNKEQFSVSTVYPKHHRRSFYSSLSDLTCLLLRPWLIRYRCNATRFGWSTSRKSWRYNCCWNALQSRL